LTGPGFSNGVGRPFSIRHMNFADPRFWEVLIASLLLALGFRRLFRSAAVVRDGGYDRAFLLALGLVLLGMVSWLSFVIHLGVAAVTYAFVRWGLAQPASQGRWLLALIVPVQLAPLFWYKYSGFVLDGMLGVHGVAFSGLVIPAGISFYTFQLVGFAVDTLIRRQPVPGLFDFFNFAGFFPQIVAGPIERRDDLLPQIQSFRLRWSPQDLDEGARWIALGAFFKFALADNLAEQFHGDPSPNPWMLWLANVLFGLRIYYDFAGYSLVALGIARCLGIRLTMNFQSPYCATSPGEFWRRWHITLSQWFRDYLYVPLGGGRVAWWAFNIGLVFVVSGVWHGAGWNFLLWGAIHAALLVGSRLTAQWKVPPAVGWAGTMVGVAFSWLFFLETHTPSLKAKLLTLIQVRGYSAANLKGMLGVYGGGGLVALAGVLALAAATLAAEAWSVRRLDRPYAVLTTPRALTVLVVLTLLLAPGKNNGFIYFAF
jgi:alginate O-acetyltransferase complex protein AlgI